MVIGIAIILLFGTTLVVGSQNCTCGQTNTYAAKSRTRIVGGTDAELHEFPLIGALSIDLIPDSVFCGSAIVTKRHAITAAHCNPRAPYGISLVAGDHNKALHNDTATVKIPVKKFVDHPQFNVTGYHENDISVVVLTRDIPFGPTVGPACFPGPGVGLDLVGHKVRMMGWGLTKYEGNQSLILQKIDVNVVPIERCEQVFWSVNPGVLCTYEHNQDSCQADSGGPVIHMNTETRRYTVVGVISRGIKCAQEGTPSVNSNISYYRDWILQVIEETAPEATTCPNK